MHLILTIHSNKLDENEAKIHLFYILTSEAKTFYNICKGEEKIVEEMLKLVRMCFHKSSVEETLKNIDNLQKEQKMTWCSFITNMSI